MERILDDVFGLISVSDADLLRQRFLYERSAMDVADELGLSRATVDQRVARAKRSLREALEKRPDLKMALKDPHPRVYVHDPR